MKLYILFLVLVSSVQAADQKPWYAVLGEYQKRDSVPQEWGNVAKRYPIIGLCDEISEKLIKSEIALYTQEERLARTHAQFKKYEAYKKEMWCSGLDVYLAPIHGFEYSIERTFHESSQEPLARLVIDAVLQYEKEKQYGWSLCYKWQNNPDGTRSLTCYLSIDPRDLE
jgi:hypothetical protein